jgi:hypothetical protein
MKMVQEREAREVLLLGAECTAQTEVSSNFSALPKVKFPQSVQSRKNINEVELSGDFTG